MSAHVDVPALFRWRTTGLRRLGGCALLAYLPAHPLFMDYPAIKATLVASGYLLVITGALVRVFATLFIGGRKNDGLAADGPYGLVRNPLYVGSLLAALGAGLQTGSLVLSGLLATLVAIWHVRAVQREELYLARAFGPVYVDYRAHVARWWPRRDARWRLPDEVVVKPRYVLRCMRDLLTVLAVLPACEAIRAAHAAGWLPYWYPLW